MKVKQHEGSLYFYTPPKLSKEIPLYYIRWFVCKIASIFGVIVHGNLNEEQLRYRLENPKLSIQATQLIHETLKGLPKVIDTHLHVLGYDRNYLNPKLDKGLSGLVWSVIHQAACGTFKKMGSTEKAMKRLQLYAKHFPKLEGMVLPICPAVNKDTRKVDWEKTGSFLHNGVAIETAHGEKKLFPATSINPYSHDWESQLERAFQMGIKWIKWMPPQGIDPSDLNLRFFYHKLKEYQIGIIAHSGKEHAVELEEAWSDYGHPSRFEFPLQLGVHVILAHSGHVESYPAFIALCEKAEAEKWPGLLFGDLGGVMHYGPEFIQNLLIESQKPHVRILYGSDYPYTNLSSKNHFKILKRHGMLDAKIVPLLNEIRDFNPLLANMIAVKNIFVKKQGELLKFADQTFTGDFGYHQIAFIDREKWQRLAS